MKPETEKSRGRTLLTSSQLPFTDQCRVCPISDIARSATRNDYFVLATSVLLQKTDLKPVEPLPTGLAHAFFPENLRSAKPIYKGKDIFSRDGLERFIEDMSRVSEFFVSFNFGARRRWASNTLRQEADDATLRSSSNADSVQL